jgi:hypothetical protein
MAAASTPLKMAAPALLSSSPTPLPLVLAPARSLSSSPRQYKSRSSSPFSSPWLLEPTPSSYPWPRPRPTTFSRARLLPKCSAAPWPNSSSRFPAVTFEFHFLFPVRWLKLKVEDDSLSLWQVGPGTDVSVLKISDLCIVLKKHILSLVTPKIVKFILLASLWNTLTIGSIGRHVLVEKFFCRNS